MIIIILITIIKQNEASNSFLKWFLWDRLVTPLFFWWVRPPQHCSGAWWPLQVTLSSSGQGFWTRSLELMVPCCSGLVCAGTTRTQVLARQVFRPLSYLPQPQVPLLLNLPKFWFFFLLELLIFIFRKRILVANSNDRRFSCTLV